MLWNEHTRHIYPLWSMSGNAAFSKRSNDSAEIVKSTNSLSELLGESDLHGVY